MATTAVEPSSGVVLVRPPVTPFLAGISSDQGWAVNKILSERDDDAAGWVAFNLFFVSTSVSFFLFAGLVGAFESGSTPPGCVCCIPINLVRKNS